MRNILGCRRDGRPIFTIAGGAPTPLEIMEGRLSELRSTIDNLFEQRGKLIDTAAAEKRGFTPAEQGTYDELGGKRDQAEKDLAPVQARVEELRTEEKREALAAQSRVQSGDTGIQSGGVTADEPAVYAKGNHQRSFFMDSYLSSVKGDRDATERLQRHAAQMADTPERRALGNTNTTGGSGGELAPPLWMVADYVKLARAGRVTADRYMKSEVPVGVSSINLPKVLTGTTVALQSTQNTALSQTDITTGSVSTGFTTVGGKQVVSQQLLDQSAIDFDTVITADLAAAYAQQIGAQILTGAGTGANNNAVVNGLDNATIANTLAVGTQDAKTFYSKSNGLLAGFAAARFAPPTCWIMHPRRWYWLMAQVDASNRPLVVPSAVAFNPIASDDAPASVAGQVGTYLGLPVYIDPNMGTAFGTGTNEDRVYLLKQDDLWLFESPTVSEVFREPYADSMGVLFRLYSYVGTILNRYPASISSLTGLTAPTF